MIDDRPELGALLHRLSRQVIARERPILAGHDLDMWDYVLLNTLISAPASSQARLAELSGRDKTRLIGNLDRLAAVGLVTRDTDPEDRRHKIISITARGREVTRSCRRQIRAMENELLGELPKADRAGLLRALLRLDDAVAESPEETGTSSA